MYTNDLNDVIRQKLEQAMKDRGHANILLAGKSGVGKSTLINAIFSGDLATTGSGRPVTEKLREYDKAGIPITLFDSRGLELKDYKATLEDLEHLMRDRRRSVDENKHIHCVWLCIAEDSRRVEDGELQVASIAAKHQIPLIAVITKARADDGFRTNVQSILPTARNVARVRALAETLDDGHLLAPIGLSELVELTIEVIPEGQRTAFVAAQKVKLELKVARAHRAVVEAAAAAALAGGTPIPFSDALVLVPIQIGMLAAISAAFGLHVDIAFLSTVVGSATGALGATMAGRALAGGLIKLIPGAGSVLGGVISATTAATLTTMVGELYIRVLQSVLSRTPSAGLPTADVIGAAFKKGLQEKLRLES